LVRTTNEQVGDYLLRWLNNHERNLAPKTAYDYGRTITVHLIPALGHVALKDLEPEHIDDYLTKKLGAGLSPVTTRLHFVVLRKALSDAVRKRRLPSNPCDAVERPKATKQERRVLDEEQTRLFLAAARRRWKPGDYVSHRNYVMFLTAMTTGLRSA